MTMRPLSVATTAAALVASAAQIRGDSSLTSVGSVASSSSVGMRPKEGTLAGISPTAPHLNYSPVEFNLGAGQRPDPFQGPSLDRHEILQLDGRPDPAPANTLGHEVFRICFP